MAVSTTPPPVPLEFVKKVEATASGIVTITLTKGKCYSTPMTGNSAMQCVYDLRELANQVERDFKGRLLDEVTQGK